MNSTEKILKVPKNETNFKHKKRYKKSWESEPEFRDWLTGSRKGLLYFYCNACKHDGVAGLPEIQQHSLRNKHILNMKTFRKNSRLQANFLKDYTSREFPVNNGDTIYSTEAVDHSLMTNRNELCSSLFVSTSNNLDDSDEMFGEYLAKELKSIQDLETRTNLKQKILNALYEADDTSDEDQST